MEKPTTPTPIRALIEELQASSRIVRPQKPATLKEIQAAESLLGVTFPRVYFEFLRACGVLNVYDRGVYGLGPYTHRRDRNVATTVFQTEYHRQSYGLPAYLVVLWDDSHQDCQCLDLRRVRNGNCPVVSHDPKAKGANQVRVIAPNFGAWLRKIVAKQEATKKHLDAEMPGRLTLMGEFRRRKRRTTAKKKGGKR